jgi:hypothetical protein
MTMMYPRLLYLLILFLGIGGTVYLFTKKQSSLYQKRFIPLLLSGLIIFLVMIIPFIISSIRYANIEQFQGVTIVNEDITSLNIISKDGTNILTTGALDEIVVYQDFNRNFQYKHYQPVYLAHFDSFDLVIYSSNRSSYEIPYFRQSDFTRVENPDILVLIHKATKKLIPIQISSLIGKTIDLRLLQLEGTTLLIPMLVAQQDKPYIMYGVTVNPYYLLSQQDYMYYDRLMGFAHSTNNSTYIKHFTISSDQILLWVDDLDNVFLERHALSFTINSSSSQVTRSQQTPLKQMDTIKNGLFRTVNGFIYYIDDALSIKKIITLDVHEEVATAPSLEAWESYIPTS